MLGCVEFLCGSIIVRGRLDELREGGGLSIYNISNGFGMGFNGRSRVYVDISHYGNTCSI